MLINFIPNLKGKIVEELNFSCIRDAPSDVREGGRTVFCLGLFLVALGLQDFFWPMLGFFLVVAFLHDLFSYYFALHDCFCD